MKPRLLLSALIFSFAALSAQTVTQSGYVRTVGRPGNLKGTRLKGAVLRVSGLQNAVQSAADGTFRIIDS